MPKAAPKPCTAPGCGVLVFDGGSRCAAHPRETSFASERRGTRQSRGYDRQWDKRRLRILQRDSHLCQVCLAAGIVTSAQAVDHIVNKAEAKRLGWTDEQTEADSNLQSICNPCHREKTLAEAIRGRVGRKSPPSNAGPLA